jgi:uncharacterized protein YndB with AHSA1/START domain
MSCDSVTREVTLPVDPDAAWETVTELEDWLVEDADLELEPGAEGTVVLEGGEERRAVVEEVEPGERLAFWWWGEGEPATFVELTLAPAVSGTRVVVVESGALVGPVAFADFTASFGAVAPLLAFRLRTAAVRHRAAVLAAA